LSFHYTKTPGDNQPNLSKGSLAKRIRILASDSLGGRRPFSDGENRTIDYLKRIFTVMDLEPDNGNSFPVLLNTIEIGWFCAFNRSLVLL
jgi:hypothetical protein